MTLDRRHVSAAAIAFVGLAVLRRLRNARRTEVLAEPTNEQIATPTQGSPVDIHRVFWERSRANRLELDFLFQGVLWLNLFTFSRGAFTGLGAIIPFAIFYRRLDVCSNICDKIRQHPRYRR